MSANTEHEDKIASIGDILRGSYNAKEYPIKLDDLLHQLNSIPSSVDSRLTSTEVILDGLIANGQRADEYRGQQSS